MTDVNTIVANFSNILISAANKSLKKWKTRKEKTNTNKKWFDLDLIKMRKTLDHKGKLFVKYPSDPFVRGNFYKYRQSYSKWCKFKRKKYKSDLVDKLDNLLENDPKTYWSLLDELRNNKRDSFESMTSPDEMFDHFSSLNILPNKFHQRAKGIE